MRQSQHALRTTQMLGSPSDDKYAGLAPPDGLFTSNALQILINTQVSRLQTGNATMSPRGLHWGLANFGQLHCIRACRLVSTALCRRRCRVVLCSLFWLMVLLLLLLPHQRWRTRRWRKQRCVDKKTAGCSARKLIGNAGCGQFLKLVCATLPIVQRFPLFNTVHCSTTPEALYGWFFAFPPASRPQPCAAAWFRDPTPHVRL